MEAQNTAGPSRRIKLLNPLGKGGFGAVYLADVTTSDGLVQRLAVKLLHESWASNAAIAARARDEARLMSQLNHDNVLKIYGLTRLSDRDAVLMEYVEGIDCRTLVIAGAQAAGAVRGLPPRVAVAIIERAAGALAAAWSNLSPQTGQPLRVVHRDIKPSNLLVSVNGAVKVMDFGVARADFEREALTGSVQFGTHRYMAPERWLKGEADHASDIYSLGVTFWELLTGVRFERLPLDPLVYTEKRNAQLARLSRTGMEATVLGEVSVLLREMLDYDETTRLSAVQVEERLGALEGRLSGEGLRRHARRVIPAQVTARMQTLREDPDLLELTGTLLVEDPPGAGRGAPAATTTPIPSLTGELPQPGEPLAVELTQSPSPTPTPSSMPTQPVLLPNLSASVTVPQRAGRTGLYVIALGLAVLGGGVTYAWSQAAAAQGERALPPVVLSSLAPSVHALDAGAAAPAGAASAQDEAAESFTASALPMPAVTAPAVTAPAVTAPAVTAPAGAGTIAQTQADPSGLAQRARAVAEIQAAVEAAQESDGAAQESDGTEALADAAAGTAPAEAPVATVTFKLIASPREGSFTLGGVRYGVGSVTLPAGSYSLDYVGPDWRRSCQVQIDAGLSRIKVEKEVPGCQSL